MESRELTRICRSFRGVLRGLQMQAGLARVIAVALVLIPPVMAMDWWVHLDSTWRTLALATWAAAVGATAWWTLLKPLKQSWSDREVLRYLDAVAPDGAGMLQDLHELQEAQGIQEISQPEGRKLADAALRELSTLPSQVKVAQGFIRTRVMRYVGICGVIAVLFGAGAAVSGNYFSIGITRFFNPFSRERWPHRTTIVVQDIKEEGTQVPQMEPFTVKALVTGDVPPQVTLAYRSESTGYLIKEKISVGANGAVSYTFPEVREPIKFSITGGDYATDTYHVGVVERPFIQKIVAAYEYPPYAGLPNKTNDGGQLLGLEGTKIKLTFDVSVPLAKALYVPAGADPEPLTKVSEKTYEKEVMLKNGDTGYAIELYDTNGYREPKPERYEIRVIPDNLPEVEVLAPASDIVGTKTVGLDVAFRARDDFGLQKVEFVYSIDGGPQQVLGDRVTGPITQKGRASEARFAWDLRKMENLPETGTMSYFVRVQDINPTGRGKAESPSFQIRILRTTDFHLEAFEAAKGILAEGLIAWRNQLEAWKNGQQWLKSGSGKEDDAAWAAALEKQETAARAAKAMETHIQTLIRQYDNNHMDQEFMASRVGQFASMLKKVIDLEHTAIAAALKSARAKTQADAAEPRMKEMRAKALTEATPRQRMAILMLDRIVRKVFDWRDLQTAAITTATILDRQEEVTDLTEKIAPKTIGKEFEDLSVDEQQKLTTLGQQQQARFDAEKQLEQQLSQQMYKARLQKRENIRVPLESAFNGLRNARVSDNLKDAAKKIQDNQPSAVIGKQKSAIQALRAVKGGLVLAGQKPDAEEVLKPEMAIVEDPKFEDAQVAEKKEEKPEDETATAASDEPLKEEDLLKVLPAGSDPLSTAISQALEQQDDVLSRSKYIYSKDGKQHMPRFLKLRTNLLRERQERTMVLMDRAIDEAGKAKADTVKSSLVDIKDTFVQCKQLVEARNWGEHSQQLQADGVAGLGDLIQFISFRRSLEDNVAENKRQNGLDAFQRQFLLRDKDLDTAADMVRNVQTGYLKQLDVTRHYKRFARFSTDSATSKIEKDNRGRALNSSKTVSASIKTALDGVSTLTPAASEAMLKAGVSSLKDLKFELPPDGSGKDQENAVAMEETQKTLANTLQSLREQFEERVKVDEPAAVAEVKPVTAEEAAKERSPETLSERIKANPSIPPAIKEKMLEVLKTELPAKHKDLLIEYYSSFAQEGEKKP